MVINLNYAEIDLSSKLFKSYSQSYPQIY